MKEEVNVKVEEAGEVVGEVKKEKRRKRVRVEVGEVRGEGEVKVEEVKRER